MAAPPELMIAQMDAVGVDKAVLYQGHVYGRLNDFLADCARRYPDRMVAVAQIPEAYGDQPEQLDEVRRAARSLGLKGLYFEIEHFRIVGSSAAVDDRRFDPLWEELTGLGMVLVWDIGRYLEPADHLKQLGRVRRIIERFPRMICILKEAQIIIKQWRGHYNTKKPHSALGYSPPAPEAIVPMDQRPVMH